LKNFLEKIQRAPYLGKLIDNAMVAIEKENPKRFRGVLPKIYARSNLDYLTLGEIINLFSRIGFGTLAKDLRREFPDVKGVSSRNIWRMRAFYLAYTEDVKKFAQAVPESSSKDLAQLVVGLDGVNLPQAVTEIPWGHNLTIINKIKDEKQRKLKKKIKANLEELGYGF